MEKNRGSQVIAIVALMVAVLGLSIGFSAFSNTLTIQSSAEVKPVDKFDVDFSTDGTTTSTTVNGTTKTIGKEGNVTPTFTGKAADDTVAGASDATISNTTSGAPKITGLHATFTEPGQTATYTFSAVNVGEYDAFLRGVVFAAANGAQNGENKVCTAKAGENAATDSLVQSACNGISVKVSVGGTEFTGTNTGVSSHSLLKTANESVVVTITYASNAARADGDFDVAFGDITLEYRSVDAS